MSDPLQPLRLQFGGSDEGLRVVRQSPPAGAASCSVTYVGPAGWGFDARGREGTARLVNQLVTSGAGPYDRVELARLLDRAGATISHQCAPESGEVTIWGPANEWRRLLRLLAEVILRPRFDLTDVSRARRQIRERQLREASLPANRVEHELLRSIFPSGHPYAGTGYGTSRSIAQISRLDLVQFHHAHYSSGDAVVVLTVPAALSDVEREVRKRFRGFRTEHPPRLELPRPRDFTPIRRTVAMPGRSQVEVRLGGRSIPRTDPKYPAAYLANEVLGGRPLLSRLFQRVRERHGLAYHASSELEAMRFGGYWVAEAGTGPTRSRSVVALLREEIRRLDRVLVSSEELKTIRESAIGEIPLALESTAEAHELAVDVAYHRLPEDYWVQWPEVLRSIRPEDVRNAASIAMDGGKAVTILAGPVAPA